MTSPKKPPTLSPAPNGYLTGKAFTRLNKLDRSVKWPKPLDAARVRR